METINLTISAQTLHAIGAGLQELPYKLAAPAMKELDAQVQDYLMRKKNEGITEGIGPTESSSSG